MITSLADHGAYSCEAINSQGSCFAGSAGCGQPGQVICVGKMSMMIVVIITRTRVLMMTVIMNDMISRGLRAMCTLVVILFCGIINKYSVSQ